MREKGWLWGVLLAHLAFQLSHLHGCWSPQAPSYRPTPQLGLGSSHQRPLFPSPPCSLLFAEPQSRVCFHRAISLFASLPCPTGVLFQGTRGDCQDSGFGEESFLLSLMFLDVLLKEKSIQLGVRGHGIQLICSSSQTVGSLWRRRVGLPNSCSSR